MPTYLTHYLKYLLQFKCSLITAILLGLTNGGVLVLSTLYIGKGIDTMVKKHQVNFTELLFILGLLIIMTLISSLSQLFIQRIGNKVAYLSTAELRKESFNHVSKLPIRYFDQHSHGDIMSRFSNDLDLVSEAALTIFNSVFSGITVILISFIAMLFLSPVLTVVVLISTCLMGFANWIIAKNSQNAFVEQQKTVGAITGFVSERVPQQKLIKLFHYENQTQIEFDVFNKRLQQVGQHAQFASSLTNPLSRFIDHLGYLSIGFIGGLLILRGSHIVTVGIISSFILYSNQFSKPLIDLSGMMTQIQSALAGLKRINQLLNEPLEENTGKKQLASSQGKIDFKHVFFSYQKERPLISDFNLSVHSGQSVAIVGKTGAGKSTLVNLLLRFYDIDSGDILLDNQSIYQFPKDDLRKQFGMVLQETWLFNGTIRDNLILGNPQASEDLIIKSCQEASIYHFIMSLPKGFDTIIGSGNLSLSEGQQQLLTIARTMISKPNILILDEATSSIDSLTDELIQKALSKLMNGRTSFIIAHRLATIANSDLIIVMDQGHIVETGTHQDLLKNLDGYYYQIYHAQFE
ncbi:ABC transporter ATP-binding protein [Vagococcus vulneris]|nr:ABC transporter ATP-binding protein [Vagococcus vulneris]